MNAREELAQIYIDTLNAGHGVVSRTEQGNRAADAIMAAGYRKPLTIDNEKLVIDDGLLLLDVGSCTCSPYGSSHEMGCGYEYIDDLTKPLARAGYRKPRTIATVAELEELAKGSVIVSHLGGVWTKYYDHFRESDNWEATGSSYLHPGDLPATVLYEPEATK